MNEMHFFSLGGGTWAAQYQLAICCHQVLSGSESGSLLLWEGNLIKCEVTQPGWILTMWMLLYGVCFCDAHFVLWVHCGLFCSVAASTLLDS